MKANAWACRLFQCDEDYKARPDSPSFLDQLNSTISTSMEAGLLDPLVSLGTDISLTV